MKNKCLKCLCVIQTPWLLLILELILGGILQIMDIMELGNHFQMLEDDEMFEEEEEEEEGEEEQSDEEQGEEEQSEEEQGEEEEGEGPDNVNSLFTFRILCMGCVIMIHYVINVAIDM